MIQNVPESRQRSVMSQSSLYNNAATMFIVQRLFVLFLRFRSSTEPRSNRLAMLTLFLFCFHCFPNTKRINVAFLERS